jgi:hypothetical protein
MLGRGEGERERERERNITAAAGNDMPPVLTVSCCFCSEYTSNSQQTTANVFTYLSM